MIFVRLGNGDIMRVTGVVHMPSDAKRYDHPQNHAWPASVWLELPDTIQYSDGTPVHRRWVPATDVKDFLRAGPEQETDADIFSSLFWAVMRGMDAIDDMPPDNIRNVRAPDHLPAR